MQIESYNTLLELESLKEDWTRLSAQKPHFVPSFSEMRHELSATGADFRVLVARDNAEVKAIACFLFKDGVKQYGMATRQLFAFPVRSVYLFSACVLGCPSEQTVQRFFQIIIETSRFDLIELGQILIDSPLYRAVKSLPGIVAWRILRKDEIRWLIDLPGSFDEYLSMLGWRTRRDVQRYSRKVEREAPEFRVIHQPKDVPDFLREAEQISRLTYQWKLGIRLRNDKATLDHFVRLANAGTLRGYLLYIQGRPCAFAWGELSQGKFAYRAIGYDPQYSKLSPGTVLYTWLIRDLIENTDCRVFDFGGGGEEGYKSRLATVSLSCVRMQAAKIYRPYPFFLFAIDQALLLAKSSMMGLLESVAGRGLLGRRLKSLLRPYGVGNY